MKSKAKTPDFPNRDDVSRENRRIVALADRGAASRSAARVAVKNAK
jgi:hypothetical protein